MGMMARGNLRCSSRLSRHLARCTLAHIVAIVNGDGLAIAVDHDDNYAEGRNYQYMIQTKG